MVVYQTVGMAPPVVVCHYFFLDGEKRLAILLVEIDGLAGITASGDVVEGARKSEAQRASHGRRSPPKALPSPILRRMSRPHGAALCLAPGCFGRVLPRRARGEGAAPKGHLFFLSAPVPAAPSIGKQTKAAGGKEEDGGGFGDDLHSSINSVRDDFHKIRIKQYDIGRVVMGLVPER